MWAILPSFILSFYAVFSLTAMAGMNISFLLVFLSALLLAIKNKNCVLKKLLELQAFKRYMLYGGILFFACLLSLVVAKIHPVIYAGHAPEITAHGFLKIWYLLCPAILAVVFSQSPSLSDSFKKITLSWWSMTLVLGVVAVIQFYTGWPLAQVIPTNPTHFHAILFFGHHLSTSSIIIFPTYTALAILFGTWTREKKLKRFELAVGLTGILILFLTYARTAWLAIPLGIIFIFVRYLKPKNLLASLIALFVSLLALSQTSLLKERISNNMGIQDRFRLWEANIDFFRHNPFTGIGWLKTQEMSGFYFQQLDPEHYHQYFWGHAHSNFFEMLGGTGLIGLLAFLAWSFFTFALAYQTWSRAQALQLDEYADFAWGIEVGLLLLHFNGLTNVTFWEGKVMHQQMLAVGFLLMLNLILAKNAEKSAKI